jgi:hypothetical protein
VHAKLANFIAGSRYDSAARGSADDEWLPRQRGIVAHFDGCVEGIHIDMQNGADHGDERTPDEVRRRYHARGEVSRCSGRLAP